MSKHDKRVSEHPPPDYDGGHYVGIERRNRTRPKRPSTTSGDEDVTRLYENRAHRATLKLKGSGIFPNRQRSSKD